MPRMASILLIALILGLCYQHIGGACPSCPRECCYGFRKAQARLSRLACYYKTTTGCHLNGVVLVPKRGRKFCADPTDQWVQDTMKTLPEKKP